MGRVTAVIDREKLRHNLQQVRQHAPQSRVMAVLCGNAYGHGLLEMAHALQGADALGVAYLQEALLLRAGGIMKPIVLLQGFQSAAELPQLLEHKIETVVSSEWQITALEQADLSAPLSVWLELDTGMHRQGIRPEAMPSAWQRLSACRYVRQPMRLMSMLGRSHEKQMSTTKLQIRQFDALCADLPGERSLASSGGILLWPDSHRDWVRVGMLLYGISPLNKRPASEFGFQPAMTLKSRIVDIRPHKLGEPTGHGSTWVSQQDTCLAVVSMGYGDGYPQNIPTRQTLSRPIPVWVNGRRVLVVGRVSMDTLTLDLGPNAQDRIGDEVILWGDELNIEEVADVCGVSSYELVTRLSARVEIEYVGD